MQVQKVKELERRFYEAYPTGFADDFFVPILKRHNTLPLVEFARKSFSQSAFDSPLEVCLQATKLIGKSSMVSVFEKMQFRDAVQRMSIREKELLAEALYHMIHEETSKGFQLILPLLKRYKVAKWTIVSAFLVYVDLNAHVLIKPTTTKKIIHFFDFPITYTPIPSYSFYFEYNRLIHDLMIEVNPELQTSTPLFTGFLMLMIDKVTASKEVS